MNEKPNNSSRNWTIVAVVAVLIGAWYWFSYRPSSIKASCSSLTYSTDGSGRTPEQQQELDTYYAECLKSKGL